MIGRRGHTVRTVEQQHLMVQEAIEATREQAGRHDSAGVSAAVRNQEVQALTLIALELRELRRSRESLNRRVGSPR